jgi:hypothetical protein
LGSYLLPFSPMWLVSRGRERESLDVLAKLRERSITDPSVVTEYRDIKLEITLLKDTETTWRELFTGRIRRRTLLGVGIMFFQQFSGINALLYYAYSQHQQRY